MPSPILFADTAATDTGLTPLVWLTIAVGVLTVLDKVKKLVSRPAHGEEHVRRAELETAIGGVNDKHQKLHERVHDLSDKVQGLAVGMPTMRHEIMREVDAKLKRIEEKQDRTLELLARRPGGGE